MPTADLTIIYYSANVIRDKFAKNTVKNLQSVTDHIPIITVTHKPVDFGRNLVVDLERSHFNIYRQALWGAREADTKYIAMAEDDVLYSPEHFKYRPKHAPFAYNLAAWSIYTWQDPSQFTHKGTVRRNLYSLICERDKFIEAMQERFDKYPDTTKVDKRLWAEPGKYERQLGVTVQEVEDFYTNPPNVVFSHETALQFEGLGTRKRLGEFRAIEIPHWGRADEVRKLYG